ncbi:MAG: hypothetical protein N3D14_01795 [Aquificaceae bacterium]|nr:hypothetical protein [Aquificaceae bacterium]MCX8164111.1 hypothetical protein [Aquificaceae bacterium]
MNVLIVSFDKNLVGKLREALKDYNVADVKNGEEAINTVSSFMDVVVYDAVSGSISEEDINNMYQQKFKDSKYIILVDDIFPVDIKNIKPAKKVKLMRDEAVNKIREALTWDVPESYEQPEDLSVSAQAETAPQEVATQVEGLVLEKLPFEEEVLEPTPYLEERGLEEIIEETAEKVEAISKRKNLLIVSFDTELIGRLKEALPADVDIREAKNMKEVMEKAKEADVIIFDTISGMLAQRTLTDMSKDEVLREKPYILLIDELFTIDADSIPLVKKYAFAREAELGKAIQKADELMKEAVQEPLTEPLLMESKEEAFTSEVKEEEASIMSLLEEIIGSGVEGAAEEIASTGLEEKPEEVKSIPEPEGLTTGVEAIANDFAIAIRDIIKSQLSRENVYSILSQLIRYEDLREEVSKTVERTIERVIEEKVEEALSKVDVAQIVREMAYKVLKERLRELIT